MNAVGETAKSTIGVTLPSTMKAYVESQAAKSGCANISEFVLSVLEDHRHRQVKSEVQAMLLETVGGPFQEWTAQTVEDIRREGTAIINRRKGS